MTSLLKYDSAEWDSKEQFFYQSLFIMSQQYLMSVRWINTIPLVCIALINFEKKHRH